jgi:hypothetical protein
MRVATGRGADRGVAARKLHTTVNYLVDMLADLWGFGRLLHEHGVNVGGTTAH